MIAKRGQFDFCDSPVINSAQLVQGNYQAPYFYNQLTDAYLNVKNYNFTLNVVQDALDADIQILNAMAESLAGAAVGAGGALFGLGIGLSEFLLSSASRITVSGTTARQGYVNEMVPPTAVYSASGTYSVPISQNRYYFWIPSTNEISAKNGNQPLLPGKKFLSQGNTLTLTGIAGKPVTASVVTRGFRDIYAQNLCLVMIDWGAVVRQQVGSKQGIGGVLYYPQVTLYFFCGGYFMATDVTLLAGAGTIEGGIILTNSEGTIASLNALTSQGAPIGQPSVFGQITPNERYDSINVAISGNTATITGVTFNGFTGVTGPAQGVFLEDAQLQFNVSADMKTITAQLPPQPSGYLIFRPTTGDVFSTRQPI